MASRTLSRTLIREGLRARVYRCIEASGRSSIIKEITDEGACGFTDWASLQFLAEIPAVEGLIPRFYAGDLAEKWYQIEDLGPSRSLDDTLSGASSAAAEQQFLELARQYGRLHAAGVGREPRFAELRAQLPLGETIGCRHEAARWHGARSKIDAWLEALAITAPSGWESTLGAISERYADPGPFLTFTHGDPAPTNNHVGDDGVRLLDFEYGAYRHALYDLTAWWALCPLPPALVARMQAAYQETTLPQLADDRAFREGWAMLCAYRALAMLTWIPPRVLEKDHPWAGDWTARSAVVTAVQRLRPAVEGVGWLEPVLRVAEGLEAELLRRFPELDGGRPDFPALRYNHPA